MENQNLENNTTDSIAPDLQKPELNDIELEIAKNKKELEEMRAQKKALEKQIEATKIKEQLEQEKREFAEKQASIERAKLEEAQKKQMIEDQKRTPPQSPTVPSFTPTIQAPPQAELPPVISHSDFIDDCLQTALKYTEDGIATDDIFQDNPELISKFIRTQTMNQAQDKTFAFSGVSPANHEFYLDIKEEDYKANQLVEFASLDSKTKQARLTKAIESILARGDTRVKYDLIKHYGMAIRKFTFEMLDAHCRANPGKYEYIQPSLKAYFATGPKHMKGIRSNDSEFGVDKSKVQEVKKAVLRTLHTMQLSTIIKSTI